MDQIMRIPFKVTTATSNFMIGVTAAASVGVYLKRGYFDPALVCTCGPWGARRGFRRRQAPAGCSGQVTEGDLSYGGLRDRGANDCPRTAYQFLATDEHG